MNLGQFIWADLSTYNTVQSRDFYTKVFGWDFDNKDEYYLARQGEHAAAGLFETPAFLQKINMPHFWMSYFQVESVEKTVALAKTLNAKIEVDTTGFYNGNIALIRDPQGAGFTVFDGKDLYLNPSPGNGSIVKTELHVSSLDQIIPFYSSLFNWKIIQKESDVYKIESTAYANDTIIKRIDNSLKGKYEYWATTILVDNLIKTTQLILQNKGKLITEEENRNLMSDNSNEAFFYIEEKR